MIIKIIFKISLGKVNKNRENNISRRKIINFITRKDKLRKTVEKVVKGLIEG